MSKTKSKHLENQASILSFFTNKNTSNNYLNIKQEKKNNYEESIFGKSSLTVSTSAQTSNLTDNNSNKNCKNSISSISISDSIAETYSFEKYNRQDENPTFIGKMYYPKEEYLFRQYQFDIVKTCLKENTLVCIPTGLGKTFIASVIIYNFHLWFKGKIFFLAPTKPLVNQQVTSFNKLFKGLNSCEITGRLSLSLREKYYETKKIFFMTPQTLDNDLNNQIVSNAEETSLIIIDEAHKAQKNYSYVSVVNKITSLSKERQGKSHQNSLIRTIGLSASPGTSIESIQNVITSLNISAIELRTEQDEEIKKFSHKKKIQIAEIEGESNQVNLTIILNKLITNRLDVMKKFGIMDKKTTINYCNMWFLLKTQKKFKEEIRPDFEENYGKEMVSEIYECFSLMMNLIRAKKLLLTQGVEALKKCIADIESGTNVNKKFNKIKSKQKQLQNQQSNSKSKTIFKQKSKAREVLTSTQEFIDLKYELFTKERSSTEKKNNLHPKLKKLQHIIFSNQLNLEKTSKAIIFTEFKDSAKEISDFLTKIFPSINSEMFHGQDRKFKQKNQLEVMRKFRDGETRIIISTSVAEEGLDIGEVDLIICYDMLSASPIRMIQRFGRTGRKRDGVVIVLASKGEEKNKYFKCISNLKYVNEELRCLCSSVKSSKIKLTSSLENLIIPNNFVNNVEFFEIENEVIDNADDFYYDSSEISCSEVSYSSNDDSNIQDEDLKSYKTSKKKDLTKSKTKKGIKTNKKFIEYDYNIQQAQDKSSNKIEIVLEEFSDLFKEADEDIKEEPKEIDINNINNVLNKVTTKKVLNFTLLKKQNIVGRENNFNEDNGMKGYIGCNINEEYQVNRSYQEDFNCTDFKSLNTNTIFNAPTDQISQTISTSNSKVIKKIQFKTDQVPFIINKNKEVHNYNQEPKITKSIQTINSSKPSSFFTQPFKITSTLSNISTPIPKFHNQIPDKTHNIDHIQNSLDRFLGTVFDTTSSKKDPKDNKENLSNLSNIKFKTPCVKSKIDKSAGVNTVNTENSDWLDSLFKSTSRKKRSTKHLEQEENTVKQLKLN